MRLQKSILTDSSSVSCMVDRFGFRKRPRSMQGSLKSNVPPLLCFRNSPENSPPHPSVSTLTNNTLWLPVRHQPATCALPCILCLSITRLYTLRFHLNQTRSLSIFLIETWGLTKKKKKKKKFPRLAKAFFIRVAESNRNSYYGVHFVVPWSSDATASTTVRTSPWRQDDSINCVQTYRRYKKQLDPLEQVGYS